MGLKTSSKLEGALRRARFRENVMVDFELFKSGSLKIYMTGKNAPLLREAMLKE